MHRDDEERFSAFVRAHSASLFRTAFLMTGDYQRAEDVLQSCLVKVYRRWSHIDDMASPQGYARRIVVTQAASWWRKRSSHEAPVPLPDGPTWSGGIEEVAEHERVWAAVLTLPPRQRAVTVLRYYEDLSEAQIAETLGISPGSVKSLAYAAKRRLAQILDEALPAAVPSEEATS